MSLIKLINIQNAALRHVLNGTRDRKNYEHLNKSHTTRKDSPRMKGIVGNYCLQTMKVE